GAAPASATTRTGPWRGGAPVGPQPPSAGGSAAPRRSPRGSAGSGRGSGCPARARGRRGRADWSSAVDESCKPPHHAPRPATLTFGSGPRSLVRPGLQLERAHAMRLGEGAGVGIAKSNDVAEHLVDRAGVPRALPRRTAGQVLQLGQERL